MVVLKLLLDKSRKKREVKLTNGKEGGKLSRSHKSKYNSRREGIILIACSQFAATLLRFSLPISKNFKEERLDSQSKFSVGSLDKLPR